MTSQPWTIQKDVRIAEAHRLMQQHGIRHLPVVDDGKLIGIVSERDIQLLEGVRCVNPNELNVEHAMVQPVYSVPAETPVDEVVEHMAESKLGSTVALDRAGNVAGIFTTIDALEFYADLLRRVTA